MGPAEESQPAAARGQHSAKPPGRLSSILNIGDDSSPHSFVNVQASRPPSNDRPPTTKNSMPGLALTFGQRVRQQRKALDLTQEALGLRVLCSAHAVRKIEADERRPSRRLAARLAEQLQIGPAHQPAFLAAARGLDGPALGTEPGDLDDNPLPGATPAAGSHAEPSSALPFVGRVPERRALRAWLAQLPTRHGRTVLVEGEAGIGKTRLAQQVSQHALHAGLCVASTKCHEIERDVAYRGLVDLIEQAAALAPAGFEHKLDGAARAEIALLVPALATRWGELPRLSPELPQARQVRLFAAVLTLFQTLAEAGGLLLVVDDLQWLDDASALALLNLARHAPGTRVLVLLACRSEDLNADPRLARLLGELQQASAFERMALPGLTRAEVGELLHAAPAGPGCARGAAPAAASPAWLDWLAALHGWSRGNPLFLASALDEGLLDHDPLQDGADEAQPGPPHRLPERVQAVVRGRLLHLSAPARRLLDAAAAAGRGANFELMVAAAADGQGTTADPLWLDALDELLQRRWLKQDDASDDDYDFLHDRLRDAVLAEMIAARRHRLHAAVARHLGAQAVASHALMAEHHEHARDWDAAVQQRLLAGAQAEALFAVQEAIAHYSRGLALAEQHPGAVPALRFSELLERRGLAHAWLSQVDLAAADLQPAVTHALARLHAGRAVELLTALGMCYQRADRYAQGADALHQALQLARELNDHKAAALAMWWLGDIDWSLDDNAAAGVWFKQVMTLCESVGLDDEVRTKAHHGLGEVAVLDARPAEGLAQFWRSLALAQHHGDVRLMCENLIVIAWAHMGAAGTGRYDAAIDHCHQVSALAEQADMPWYHPPALIGKGAALAALGRFGEALACFGPSLELARALGMARFEAMALTWLAECCLDAEQPALALAHATQARHVMDQAGTAFFSHTLRAVHAQALLRLGRLNDVPDLYAALQRARERQLGHVVLRTLDVLTEWHHARSEHAAAHRCAREWGALARARGVGEMRARALVWSARLHAERGRHARALKQVEQLLAGTPPLGRFSLRLSLHRLGERCARAVGAGSAPDHAAAVRSLEQSMADAAPALTAFSA